MSTQRDPQSDDPDPQLGRALDGWKAPRAREEFRAQLRAKFLAEPFEARAGDDGLDTEPRIDVAEPLRPDFSLERLREPRPGRSRWTRLAALLAVAAAIVIALRWPSPAGWRVAASSSFSLVRVDGREFRPGAGARLAASLIPGSVIEVEGGSLDLVLDERVALSLSAGSALSLAEIPQPGVLAEIQFSQQRGSLAVATGPGFTGSELSIQTPDARVRVVGTQFAVDVDPGQGTCVCCSEGVVEVTETRPGAAATPAVRVQPGQLNFVFSDAQPAKAMAAMEGHLAPLQALRQVWAGGR